MVVPLSCDNSVCMSWLNQSRKNILRGGLFYKLIIHCSANQFSEKVSMSPHAIKTIKTFREFGTCQNLNSKGPRGINSGQRVSARTERNIDDVRDSVARSPKKSLRRRSQELGIS